MSEFHLEGEIGGSLLFVYPSSFIEEYLVYKELHTINVHNLLSLEIGIYSFYHHHNQGNKYIHHLQQFPCVPLGLCVCVC